MIGYIAQYTIHSCVVDRRPVERTLVIPMTDLTDADVTIDSREATCPGPLMDLIGRVKTLDPGTVVALRTTERNSTTDVPEWLEKAGHDLIEIDDGEEEWTIYLEVT